MAGLVLTVLVVYACASSTPVAALLFVLIAFLAYPAWQHLRFVWMAAIVVAFALHFVMERGIRADLSLVKAWKADPVGNLVYRKTSRNFNPNVAMAGKITIVEVEELVGLGDIDPDAVHTPGIFVHRIVVNQHPEKRIEQRTVRAQ